MVTELPTLEGTERQTNWANSIRAQVLSPLNDYPSDAARFAGVTVDELPEFTAWLVGHTTAKWWIDSIGTDGGGSARRRIPNIWNIGRTWRRETGR